jgi:hypothetical protein
MSAFSAPNRRELLVATAAVGAMSMIPSAWATAAVDNSMRSFTVNIPQAELDELRQRIAVTRWPDEEIRKHGPGAPIAT